MQRKNNNKMTKLNDKSVLLQFMRIRGSAIQSLMNLAEDRFNPQKVLDCKNAVEEYELHFYKNKIEFQMLGLLDLGVHFLHPKLRTYVIEDSFAYEKSQEYFLQVQKLYQSKPIELSAYQPLLDASINIGLIYVEAMSKSMSLFKINYRAERKANKRVYKKDLMPNIISPINLLHDEANENTALAMTQKIMDSDKKIADEAALKICQIWDANLKESQFEEFFKYSLDELKSFSELKTALYTNFLMMYRNLLTMMISGLQQIIDKHYSDEAINLYCQNFETIDAKNMQIIFSHQLQMLTDGIMELRQNKFILLSGGEKSIIQILDHAENTYKKINETNEKIESSFAVAKQLAEAKKQAEKIFVAQLVKRESIKRKFFLKTTPVVVTDNSATDETKSEIENNRTTPPLENKDAQNGYSLYLNGKYAEAIKFYLKLLPKNLNECRSIEEFKIIYTIGDCYKAWSENLLREIWNSKQYRQLRKLSYHYKKLAKENYKRAYQGFKLGSVEHREAESAVEWRMWLGLAASEVEPKRDAHRYFDKKAIESAPIPAQANLAHSLPSLPAVDIELKSQPFDISLPEWIDEITNIFNENKIKGYIVGGALRDEKPNDYDFVIDAQQSLNEVKNLLNVEGEIYCRMHPILKIKKDADKIEISPLCANTNPTKLKQVTLDNGAIIAYTPGTILEDAPRRNFTFNALYYDPEKKVVLDPTGKGLVHFNARLICTVIDPDESFKEDPVRILQAVRLSVKGCKIEKFTFKAMIRNAPLLQERNQIMNPQRLLLEISKMIAEKNIYMGIHALNTFGLLKYIFPDVCPYMNAEKSLSWIFIQNMLIAADNPYIPKDYINLPLFLSVMFWPPIQEQIANCKNENKNKAETYGVIVDVMEETIKRQTALLGLIPELQDNIRLIWRYYLSKSFRQNDQYLLNTKYSVDDLMVMGNFFTMLKQASIQLNGHYQPLFTIWQPKPTMVNQSKTMEERNYFNPTIH